MKGISLAWLARNVFTVVAAIVVLSCAGGVVYVSAQRSQSESAKVKALSEEKLKLADELGTLHKKFSDLETDRNNVLAQTRVLLQDKAKFTELQEAYAKLEETSKHFGEQKDKLHKLNVELQDELASLEAERTDLTEALREEKNKTAALSKTNGELKTALDQKVEFTPQYREVQTGLRAAQSENGRLVKLNGQLEEALKSSRDRVNKAENREGKSIKQMEELKKKYDGLKAENDKLLKVNKDLNIEVKLAPQKFKDMGSQNRAMIKEMAEMHYNLGVFFVDNKNYDLARREFERVFAYNPDHAKAHYNLGYLYSAHFAQHDKAMAHFQRYLEIDPRSKESAEIRTYMLERQTYGDKLSPLPLSNTNPRLKK